MLTAHERLFESELRHRIQGLEILHIPAGMLPYFPTKDGLIFPTYVTAPGSFVICKTIDELVDKVVKRFVVTGPRFVEHERTRRLFYYYHVFRLGQRFAFAGYVLTLSDWKIK